MTQGLHYIAVEGPIGVGKTSLASLLAEEFNYRAALERAEDNPFLSTFYKDRSKYSFQTQLFFLLSRYQQQKEMLQQDLFQQGVVTDYIFAKDKIFALLNLLEDELRLYESVYNLLDGRILKPDLVVFLQASTDILLNRVKKRKIDYEKNLDEEYLERLSDAYSRFFFSYQETPLLVVNCSEMDFVEKPEDYKIILREILHMKTNKLEKHYVTISSK
ncbi:MAG: deoxynucleoside kinase [Deltaproteobacteria bacterium]|nr:deoxynucleoside kinase [Deltaproteobacteria bacterium]